MQEPDDECCWPNTSAAASSKGLQASNTVIGAQLQQHQHRAAKSIPPPAVTHNSCTLRGNAPTSVVSLQPAANKRQATGKTGGRRRSARLRQQHDNNPPEPVPAASSFINTFEPMPAMTVSRPPVAFCAANEVDPERLTLSPVFTGAGAVPITSLRQMVQRPPPATFGGGIDFTNIAASNYITFGVKANGGGGGDTAAVSPAAFLSATTPPTSSNAPGSPVQPPCDSLTGRAQDVDMRLLAQPVRHIPLERASSCSSSPSAPESPSSQCSQDVVDADDDDDELLPPPPAPPVIIPLSPLSSPTHRGSAEAPPTRRRPDEFQFTVAPSSSSQPKSRTLDDFSFRPDVASQVVDDRVTESCDTAYGNTTSLSLQDVDTAVVVISSASNETGKSGGTATPSPSNASTAAADEEDLVGSELLEMKLRMAALESTMKRTTSKAQAHLQSTAQQDSSTVVVAATEPATSSASAVNTTADSTAVRVGDINEREWGALLSMLEEGEIVDESEHEVSPKKSADTKKTSTALVTATTTAVEERSGSAAAAVGKQRRSSRTAAGNGSRPSKRRRRHSPSRSASRDARKSRARSRGSHERNASASPPSRRTSSSAARSRRRPSTGDKSSSKKKSTSNSASKKQPSSSTEDSRYTQWQRKQRQRILSTNDPQRQMEEFIRLLSTRKQDVYSLSASHSSQSQQPVDNYEVQNMDIDSDSNNAAEPPLPPGVDPIPKIYANVVAPPPPPLFPPPPPPPAEATYEYDPDEYEPLDFGGSDGMCFDYTPTPLRVLNEQQQQLQQKLLDQASVDDDNGQPVESIEADSEEPEEEGEEEDAELLALRSHLLANLGKKKDKPTNTANNASQAQQPAAAADWSSALTSVLHDIRATVDKQQLQHRPPSSAQRRRSPVPSSSSSAASPGGSAASDEQSVRLEYDDSDDGSQEEPAAAAIVSPKPKTEQPQQQPVVLAKRAFPSKSTARPGSLAATSSPVWPPQRPEPVVVKTPPPATLPAPPAPVPVPAADTQTSADATKEALSARLDRLAQQMAAKDEQLAECSARLAVAERNVDAGDRRMKKLAGKRDKLRRSLQLVNKSIRKQKADLEAEQQNLDKTKQRLQLINEAKEAFKCRWSDVQQLLSRVQHWQQLANSKQAEDPPAASSSGQPDAVDNDHEDDAGSSAQGARAVAHTLHEPPTAAAADDDAAQLLSMFKCYRATAAFAAGHRLTSVSFSHAIHVDWPLCPFELHGVCADNNCPWQHFANYRVPGVQLLVHILQYYPLFLKDKFGIQSVEGLFADQRVGAYCDQLLQAAVLQQLDDDDDQQQQQRSASSRLSAIDRAAIRLTTELGRACPFEQVLRQTAANSSSSASAKRPASHKYDAANVNRVRYTSLVDWRTGCVRHYMPQARNE